MLSFFFNDTATTEIYTLSLHDALPICIRAHLDDRSETLNYRIREGEVGKVPYMAIVGQREAESDSLALRVRDRKSTRLNSSHLVISYAVFCLKKKKKATSGANVRVGQG